MLVSEEESRRMAKYDAVWSAAWIVAKIIGGFALSAFCLYFVYAMYTQSRERSEAGKVLVRGAWSAYECVSP